MSFPLRFVFWNIRGRNCLFFEKSPSGNVFLSFLRQRQWIKIQKYSSQKNSENIVQSPIGRVELTPMSLHERVFYDWSLWEKKIAIRCGLTGRSYKYRDLRKMSLALAGSLQKKFKLEKQDKFAVILPNCPEYPVIILAASLIGAVVTLVNPMYMPFEIQRHIEETQAKLIFTCSSVFDKCFGVVQSMKKSIPIIVLKMTKDDIIPEGAVNFSDLLDPSNSDSLIPVNVDENDVILIPFSSGTTGSPKGVLLTHKNIAANLTQVSHPETSILTRTTRFHQDKVLAVLPMFHVYGLMSGLFFPLKEGSQVILLPSFNPALFVKSIFKHQVAVLYTVAPILKVLTDKRVTGFHLRSIRSVVNGASAPSTQDVFEVLKKAPHIKICQGYGMSETLILSHTPLKGTQKLTSIGIPLVSTVFKVVHTETGEILGKGETGELYVSGPQVMKGYLDRPEETREAFDSEGYLKTGDIVYYDEGGNFFVTDRLKDLIKVKGFQVAPTELEEVLRMHPKIIDAAVVGVSDPVHGEVPKAFIIAEKDSQLTEEEVQDFIKKKLSHYKQLKGGVVFVDDLPRNHIGKVLRKELKDK